jgi:hypothetical protein
MPTQEVPHYEWARFFDEFSRQHQSWLVTVEMTGERNGHQVQVRDLPLVGIMVEPNEIGEDEITIIAGSRPEAHISHTVRLPRRVFLKQNDEAEDESVEIESFGGTVLVSFGARALTETLDGLRARRAIAQ